MNLENYRGIYSSIVSCWGLFFQMFNLYWVWDLEVPKNIHQLLSGTRLPSKAHLLWVNGFKALISELWFKRNQRVFKVTCRYYMECFNIAKFKVSQWCVISDLFSNYSPSMICMNWKALITPPSSDSFMIVILRLCYLFSFFFSLL